MTPEVARLFPGLAGDQPTVPAQPRIVTPFGEILTALTASAVDTTRSAPDEQRLLPGGAEWRRWSTGPAAAEVLIGPYVPRLPPDMSVQRCTAVGWAWADWME